MSTVRSFGSIAVSALVYAMIALAAGWLLGPMRVLLLEPRIGKLAATIVEVPLMLSVSYWAAPRAAGFGGLRSHGAKAAMGVAAAILLQAAEFGLGLMMFRASLTDQARALIAPPGLVYLVALAGFALMPWLRRKAAFAPRTARSPPTPPH